MDNDNKKRCDVPDPMAEDRALAYQVPDYLDADQAEYQYKQLSGELDSLRAHLD
jgi:hypothetical protein